MHELPRLSKTGILPFSHMPTRMQLFVLRNWSLVEPAVLARVLGCTEADVRRVAADMGLDPHPAVSPDWLTKGYITIIRANWHIATMEQIADLLGWTTDKLAFILREDDFLSHKLGHTKPDVPPVKYTQLTPDEITRTARIREIVTEALAALPETQAKPFDFEPLFAAAIRPEAAAPSDAPTRFENRIIYSYCALYGDTFADRALIDASFPDTLLEAYASLGITGVWTQAVLYTLVPYPFDETLSEGWEGRIEGMRYLVGKLAKYGLKLFLYLNEPRAMPASFFEKYPDLLGHVNESTGYGSLCVSTDAVRDYLREASCRLVSAVPELGGYLTITASENHTNCYSHTTDKTCDCPRCKQRAPSDVIADVNRCLYEGAAAVNPDFTMLAWNWAWSSREADMTHKTLDKMPGGISIMCVSEEGVKKDIGGTVTSVLDYSLSIEGPGDFAKDTWGYGHKSGHKAYAKLQLGCTWEMAAVPCVPAFEKITRHLRRLTECGVDGIMLGWTLGGFPSPTLRIAQGFYGSDVPTDTELWQRAFPDGNIPALTEAFHTLSEAFDHFPFHISTAYVAPQLYGSSNLLYPEPTGYGATMVGFPYDALDSWRSIFPRETFLSQLHKLSDGWHAGRLQLEAAAAGTSDEMLRALVRWTALIDCHFASMVNQSEFVLSREKGVLDKNIAAAEAKLAAEVMALQAVDPTIGYESSNHYFFTRNTLLEKLINCDDILNRA